MPLICLLFQDTSGTSAWGFSIISGTKGKTIFVLTSLYSLLIAPGLPWQCKRCTDGWAKIWRAHETHHPLWNILDPSTIKEIISCGKSSGWQVSAFIPCRTKSQNTIASCFLSALILGSGPAGSEIYSNEVPSLFLAISATYEFCKFRSGSHRAFLLLTESSGPRPSLSWECPSTVINA